MFTTRRRRVEQRSAIKKYFLEGILSGFRYVCHEKRLGVTVFVAQSSLIRKEIELS